jgi:hypothetical protein
VNGVKKIDSQTLLTNSISKLQRNYKTGGLWLPVFYACIFGVNGSARPRIIADVLPISEKNMET